MDEMSVRNNDLDSPSISKTAGGDKTWRHRTSLLCNSISRMRAGRRRVPSPTAA